MPSSKRQNRDIGTSHPKRLDVYASASVPTSFNGIDSHGGTPIPDFIKAISSIFSSEKILSFSVSKILSPNGNECNQPLPSAGDEGADFFSYPGAKIID